MCIDNDIEDLALAGYEVLTQGFHVLDTNGDGVIDADELKDVLTELSEAIIEDNAEEVIAAFDEDGDGHIDEEEYDEFVDEITDIVQGILDDHEHDA